MILAILDELAAELFFLSIRASHFHVPAPQATGTSASHG
jgi:hypothetical protein